MAVTTFQNSCNGSGGSHYTLYIKVDVQSQNVANNTSHVVVTMYGKSDSNSYGAYNNGGGCSYSLTVDGKVRASSSSASMDFRNQATVSMGSWEGDIAHNTNGTKTLSVSGSFSFSGSSYLSGGSCSGSLNLATIARASSVSIANKTATLGSSDTITVTSSNTSFKHTIKYTYTATNGSNITRTLTSNLTGKTSLTYAWTPALSEANNITNSQTASGTLTCYTYTSGGALIGSKSVGSVVLKVPSNSNTKPTFTSVTISDGASTNYYGTFGVFIGGLSRPKFEAKFGGKYGATVKSFKMTIDDYNYNAANINSSAGTASITTYPISTSGTITGTLTLTDSRGITTTETRDITVAKYSPPVFTDATAERKETDNTKMDLNMSVIASKINTDKNKIKVTYQYKKASESDYSSEVVMINQNATGSTPITKAATLSSISADETYNVIFTATDTVGSVATREISVGTEFVTMDFYRDGTGVGFGRVAPESNVMAINMDVAISKTGASSADDVEGVYIDREGWISIKSSSSPFIGFADKDDNFTSIRFSDNCIFIDDVKLYYRSGDTITLTGTVGGAVTNSKKSVLFKIPLGKPIADITEASITSLKLTVRQNANYIVGSASAGAVVTGYTGTLSRNDCSMNTAYVASAALPNSINNAPCGVSYEATIKFK